MVEIPIDSTTDELYYVCTKLCISSPTSGGFLFRHTEQWKKIYELKIGRDGGKLQFTLISNDIFETTELVYFPGFLPFSRIVGDVIHIIQQSKKKTFQLGFRVEKSFKYDGVCTVYALYACKRNKI